MMDAHPLNQDLAPSAVSSKVIFLVITTIDTTEIYYTTDRTTQVDDNSPLSPFSGFHNFTWVIKHALPMLIK